jgi:hypothetical protein
VLYLIGGTPRSGKSILARQINRETGLPIVSTDLLRGVLMQVDQELREAMIARDPIREAQAFFPHLAQTLKVAEIQLDDCLIEGIGFLPRDVPPLREIAKGEVHACFVGRSIATPEDLFGHETEHRIYDDWTDEQRTALASGIEGWTVRLRENCAEHGVPFVDLAVGFDDALQKAKAILLDSNSPSG